MVVDFQITISIHTLLQMELCILLFCRYLNGKNIDNFIDSCIQCVEDARYE